ncbi:MAG: hypothetical protein IKZ03_00180, partial [Clostridia bacterium]|nr:hypothetical protein [Clostridia bacterium]
VLALLCMLLDHLWATVVPGSMWMTCAGRVAFPIFAFQLVEGYFHTGDYGRVELEGEDQWIYITGRLKNLIILSNGKNVYPEEIETDIQGVYGVGEVVVYAGESKDASPDGSNPDIIVAEIFPNAEALKLRGITDAQAHFEAAIKEINAKNVSYKRVDRVKLREEEFPKNTSRKITRFKIDKTV